MRAVGIPLRAALAREVRSHESPLAGAETADKALLRRRCLGVVSTGAKEGAMGWAPLGLLAIKTFQIRHVMYTRSDALKYYLYAHIALNVVRVPQGFPLFDVGPINWSLHKIHTYVPPLRPVIFWAPRGTLFSKL